MQTCSVCGVTGLLAKEHRWRDNGTITLAADPEYRMVIVDSRAFVSIFDSISERIGVPLDDIVAEVKRRSGRQYCDTILEGAKGFLARTFASKLVYERSGRDLAMLGYGTVHVTDYRRHEFLRASVADVYYQAPMAGDLCGIFESVERRDAGVEWNLDNSTLIVIVTAGLPHREEYVERFEFVPPPALPGTIGWAPCPSCGVPLEVGRLYEFEPDRGIITERKTGRRVVSMGMGTMNKFFNELELELGEEIPFMIMDIERARIRDTILSRGNEMDTSEAGYLRFLEGLALRGMGVATSASWEGERVTVRIDNPYYEPLNAAPVAGFFEATTGRSSDVEWTRNTEGHTIIRISPGR